MMNFGQENLMRAFMKGMRIFISSALLLTTSIPGRVNAQEASDLPHPGTFVSLSPRYTPVIIAGITLHPENPLQFDFIVDVGDDHLQGEELKKESQKLISYFMAALTVPENEMWVNLSPYEKDRIMAEGLGKTVLGRDMLAQDYLLKQLTASMMSPESDWGSKFWERIYSKVQEKFGTVDIPTDAFNKIWIVPEKASIYINDKNVFVADSHLQVMLEEDYLALEHHDNALDGSAGKMSLSQEAKAIFREILLPEIEREVNEGKNFSSLRQMYHSMILAAWFKKSFRDSLLGKVYVDQNKVQGVATADKDMKQKIYDQYIAAFKKGVYDFIKEEYDAQTQQVIPRKYFSGGEDFAQLSQKALIPTDVVGPETWLKQRMGSAKVIVPTRNQAHYRDGTDAAMVEEGNRGVKKYTFRDELTLAQAKTLTPNQLPDYPYLVQVIDRQRNPIMQPLEAKDPEEKSWSDFVNERMNALLALLDRFNVVGLVGPSRSYKTEVILEAMKTNPDIGFLDVSAYNEPEIEAFNWEFKEKIGDKKIAVLDEYKPGKNDWMLDILTQRNIKVILIRGGRLSNQIKKSAFIGMPNNRVPPEAVYEITIKPLNKRQIRELAENLMNQDAIYWPELARDYNWDLIRRNIERLVALSDTQPVTPFVITQTQHLFNNHEEKLEAYIKNDLSLYDENFGTIFSLAQLPRIYDPTDHALLSEPNKGGIDFNSNNLNMQVQGDEITFDIPADLQGIPWNFVDGFTPVIIDVVPVNNFPALLGDSGA